MGGSLFLQESLLLVLWEQTRAILGCSHCCSSPQDRTLGRLFPLACGESLAPWTDPQTSTPGDLNSTLMPTAGNLLMVLEEIQSCTSTSQCSQSLSRCGAGGAFSVGGCTKVFQVLVTSSMTSEWVSGDLLGDGTFSAKSSLSQRPRGTRWALSLGGC